MRVLLDECLPERLRQELPDHQVATAREAGLAGKKDGVLLDLACTYFDALITIDRGLPEGQQIGGRNLGVIVIHSRSNGFTSLAALLPQLRQALSTIRAGQVARVPD